MLAANVKRQIFWVKKSHLKQMRGKLNNEIRQNKRSDGYDEGSVTS